MKRESIFYISSAGIIAALYTVLTLVSASFGLSSGVIQIRLSEMLTVLPFFTPAAVPGLAIGCVVANLLTGAMALDVFFGSLATFLGAAAAYYIGKAARKAGKPALLLLVPLPNVLANTLIIPHILKHVYNFEGSLIYFTATVGAGEILSSFCLGVPLLFLIQKNKTLRRLIEK